MQTYNSEPGFEFRFATLVKVLHRSTVGADDQTMLSLSDDELGEEIRTMSAYIDKLLEKISFSLKNSSSDKMDPLPEVPSDADEKYRELHLRYQKTLKDLARAKRTQFAQNYSKSAENLGSGKRPSLRSRSTTTLSSFFGEYDKRQRLEMSNIDSNVKLTVPNNSPKSKELKRTLTIDLDDQIESRTAVTQSVQRPSLARTNSRKLERLDSVTQSLISITDEFAENELLNEFNTFTEKLTDTVIRQKQIPETIIGQPDLFDDDAEDEVFLENR